MFDFTRSSNEKLLGGWGRKLVKTMSEIVGAICGDLVWKAGSITETILNLCCPPM
jgi:hypothetical protein